MKSDIKNGHHARRTGLCCYLNNSNIRLQSAFQIAKEQSRPTAHCPIKNQSHTPEQRPRRDHLLRSGRPAPGRRCERHPPAAPSI